MRYQLRRVFFSLLLVAAWIVGLSGSGSAQAQNATELFDEFADRIYQIRILDRNSGKQAGLGSGFLIDNHGAVVTNYHVIAEYTARPERYTVEYLHNDGTKGQLRLVNIDVVNDLALLAMDVAAENFLTLAGQLPAQGESIYSIGNPHDLGWTVVPGTYNGITAHSLYERIHFSGSVNPGMSGGPVLNAAGEVIGVNVATAGNQVSFLVPLNRVRRFIEHAKNHTIAVEDIDAEITRQLRSNQAELIEGLIGRDWESTAFGNAIIPSEIATYIKCWGLSDDDPEILYEHSATVCNSEEEIYLSSEFTTGNVAYQFNWLESDELNSFRFYNMYKDKISSVYPDNDAGKEDVTDYECLDDFILTKGQSGTHVVTKGSFCAREYKRYRGLYDILYFGATVHEDTQALISHFTFAGVTQEAGMLFLEKFLANTRWK